ncbi:YhcB family protein [Phytohalomonas tamaricis]|uniref:YhcB family protein n=1 Tax=Phytohalomonas tamaricis TaxID=2081032 RepID=UPI000D0BC320|nr:DUF1043 family protein [Phytohalomonas tamaricis]
MNESNIDWILALACLLAGIGIGAIGYHLLNANVARNQKVRQKLAETELELNQVRDSLNNHFAQAAELISNIQRQSQELQQQIMLGADKLSDDVQLKRRLHQQGGEELVDDENESSLYAPRDYAEGTDMSDDYVIAPKHEQDSTQPPRY